ncbi:MAG: hypothetical protein JRF27_01655 [Deltaproteobacteria bacterium]|nr:hypothetical protein [Deltaproteobacteria bacterium]
MFKLEDPSRRALWNWVWVVAFAVAFAWVESAVVVYLREIYFDGTFSFPLTMNWQDGKHVIDPLIRIELGREAATLLMLVTVGCAAGRNFIQKFSYFIIAFGVWDIFYYIWLWVMLRWPQSLMTWDLLFYIPLPWVGPVITPVLIAMSMVAAGSVIIYFDETVAHIRFHWYDWIVELICTVFLIVAFCWDWKNIMQVPGGEGYSGIPNPFAWWLYGPVYLFSVAYFAVRLRRIVHTRKRQLPEIH